MKAFESNSKELLKCLTNTTNFSPISLLDDMNEFVRSVHESEIGMCSSILFNEEKGVFKFCQESLLKFRNVKIFTNARKTCFDLVLNYINFIGVKISDYSLLIKKYCLYIFRREDSNTVKNATFGPLFALLDLDLDKFSAEDIEVNDMFRKYLKEYRNSKCANSVKGKILEFLGFLCEKFPSNLTEYQITMRDIYLKSLFDQSKKKKPDRVLITSSFKGLTYFLTHFGDTIQEEKTNKKVIQPLYNFICKVLELEKENRYDMPKAALTLLSKHGFLFKEHLVVDSIQMFSRLEKKCTHKNVDLRRKGFAALTSFLSYIVQQLMTDTSENINRNRKVFFSLKSQFSRLMNPSSKDKQKISMAILAFGQLAPAFRKFSGMKELKVLMTRMFQFSEQLLHDDNIEENAYQIPNLLSAFAGILLEVDDINQWIIDNLLKLVTTQCRIWPKQSYFQRAKWKIYSCLIKLFIALFFKKNSLQILLKLFSNLTLSFAMSKISVKMETKEEKSIILNDLFFELWQGLFNPNVIKIEKFKYPWNQLGITDKNKLQILQLLYDSEIEQFLSFCNMFDLSCHVKESTEVSEASKQISSSFVEEKQEEEVNTEMVLKLVPNNQGDFNAFLQLVEFQIKFLKRYNHLIYFPKWVFLFCRNMIELSEKFPLVSAFYKLLNEAMTICKKVKFFENIAAEIDENKKTTYKLLNDFSGSVIDRLNDCKGELLISCLKFLLAMPTQFIDVNKFIEPLRITFVLGLSFLPLSTVGLNTLEYWLKKLPSKDMDVCLSLILPHLNLYLIVETEKEERIKEFDEKSLKTKLKTGIKKVDSSKIKRKRKYLSKKIFSELELSSLRKIQQRIIRLLGRFGGKNYQILQDHLNKEDKIPWDSAERINIKMHFQDFKPEIAFDSTLKRIVELAEKSGERQIKVAACEYLHSVVLWMVGKNAKNPNVRSQRSQEKPTPFYKIYQKLFPTILKLSVDPENVTRQLFHPLIFQIVHWLTQNMEYEHKETMSLLDAIIDGLCHPTHGDLRDICAKLVKEFMVWSIKHDHSDDFKNIKSLFQRLYDNSHHPNRYKRLGAMLAFNKIYIQFREHEKLIERYVFDWLHNVIVSLKISNIDKDDENSPFGVIKNSIDVVDHIVKIIYFRKSIVNAIKSPDRGLHKSFAHLVEWIFSNCGSLEKACRKQCQKIFPHLCKSLIGFDTDDGPRRWIFSKMKNKGNSYVVDVAEEFNLESNENRIVELTAAIDTYNWLFNNRYVNPNQIYPFSSVLEQMKSFVCNTINSDNCSLLLLLFDFISLNLERFKEVFLKQKEQINFKILIRNLIITILLPFRNGFNTTNSEVQKKIHPHCKRLCKVLVNSHKSDLVKITSKVVKRVNIVDPKLNVNDSLLLLRGYKILHELNLIEEHSQKNFVEISKKLHSTNMKTLSPNEIVVNKELFSLSFFCGLSPSILLEFLCNDSLETTKEDKMDVDDDVGSNENSEKEAVEKTTTKGEIFYQIFKFEINSFLLNNFKKFSKAIMMKVGDGFGNDNFFIKILFEMTSLKNLKESDYIEEVLKYFQVFEKLYNEDVFETKLSIIKLIERMIMLDSVSVLGHSSFNQIFQIIVKAIETKRDNFKPTMQIKIIGLKLVPHIFIANSPKILELIENVVVYEFPIDFRELGEATQEFTDHVLLLRTLFEILASTRNVDLFKKYIPLYRWTEHIIHEEMNKNLVKFLQEIDSKEKIKVANFCLETLYDETNPIDIRKSAIQWICLNCLQVMEIESTKKFFLSNMQKIHTKQDTKRITKTRFITLLCNLNLLEAMYRLLSKNDVDNLGGKNKGKTLTRDVIKYAYTQRNRKFSNEEISNFGKDLVLEFHQSAYNTLAGSCFTQTKEKFYHKFLFENKSKNNWEHIIDLDKVYKFEVEVDFILQEKVISDITKAFHGKENVKKKRKNILSFKSSYFRSESTPYLNTDLFSPVGTFGADLAEKIVDTEDEEFIQSGTTQAYEQEKISGKSLEMDVFNSHPCMSTVLRVIDHMFGNLKFTNQNPDDMCVWMKTVHQILSSDDSHINVKMFLTKLILNRPEIFKQHKKRFLKPLIKIAQHSSFGEIHYFLRDICVLLLRWEIKLSSTIEEKKLVSSLISFLMKICSNSKSYIFKANIQLIQVLIEQWKDSVTIPRIVLVGWLNYPLKRDSTKTGRMTGLQLCGAILGIGISVYDRNSYDDSIREDKFYFYLLQNLTYPRKVIYEAAAEVSGLILDNLKPFPKDNNEIVRTPSKDEEKSYVLFSQLLTAELMKFYNNNNIDKFLYCLLKIGSKYPPFLDTYISKIFDLLPNQYGIHKQIALKLICWRAKFIPELFIHLTAFLSKFLHFQEDSTQLLTLQSIKSILPQLTKEQILYFLSVIEKKQIIQNEIFSENVRSVYYDILIEIYDSKPDLKNNSVVRFSLLRGMSDKSPPIREKLLQFWNDENRLSIISKRRLEQIFTLLYSKDIVDQKWLNFSTFLLLKLLEKDSDYRNNSSIFEDDLGDCKFHEIDVDLSYTGSLQTFQPLFSQSTFTLSSFEGFNKTENKKKDRYRKRKANEKIKATQNLLFSQQTQMVEDQISSYIDPSKTQKSLMFLPAESVNEMIKGVHELDQKDKTESEKHKIPRRFKKLKDESQTDMIIRRASRRKKEQDKKREKMKQKRKNLISLYRNYRVGELPDILISPEAIWKPLMALCLFDSVTAKQVFIKVFNSLFDEVYNSNQNNLHIIVSKIQKTIQDLINNSKENSILISTIFHICIENTKLQEFLSCESIASASLQSYCIESGILLIEKIIINHQESIKDPMKIDDFNEDELEKTIVIRKSWIELAKLYKVLGENDIVLSIFENHVAQHSKTKEGLKLELIGSFTEATKVYKDGIEKWEKNEWGEENKPSEEELNFWKRQFLLCHFNNNNWELIMNSIAKQQLNVWEDSEFLLPIFLESQLKTSWGKLMQFIETSSENNTKKGILETKYSDILASISMKNKEYEKARSNVHDGYGNFLREWSSFPSHTKTGKHVFLQKLQRLVEIEEFIFFLYSKNKKKTFKNLLSVWDKRFPSIIFDNPTVWANVIANRMEILDYIEKYFEKNKISDVSKDGFGEETLSTEILTKSFDFMDLSPDDEKTVEITLQQIKDEINSHIVKMNRLAAKSSRKQLNITVAAHFLKQIKKRGGGYGSAIIKLLKIKANRSIIPDEIEQSFRKTLDQIKEREDAVFDDINEFNKCLILKSEVYNDLYEKMNDYEVNFGETQTSLLKKNYDLYLKICESCGSDQVVNKIRSKAYYKFASFTNKIIQNKEVINMGINTPKFYREVVKFSLLSIKHNFAYVKELFPTILEIIEKNEKTRQEFTRGLEGIPKWVFLFWFSQMLPHLSGKEGDCLIPIILYFAKNYPQAIFYQFNISNEDIKPQTTKVRDGIALIKTYINKKEFLRFVKAFEMMTHPELQLQDAYSSIMKNFMKKDFGEVKRVWSELYEEVFDKDFVEGDYNKKYLKNFSGYVKKNFGGKEGKKLLKLTPKKLKSYFEYIISRHKKNTGYKKSVGPNRLSQFSNYLPDFHQKPETIKIEIPGQYEYISSEPYPKKNVKIVSFSQHILVMGSLRKPKRVIINGDNEKEYKFLVKGGEDLRQDQRIEQLFSVMNNLLQTSPNCLKRGLHIRVYKVIPMSKKAGILEWVENGKTFKEMIEGQIAVEKGEKIGLTSYNGVAAMRIKFVTNKAIKNYVKNADYNSGQIWSYVYHKDKDVRNMLFSQYEKVPQFLFKDALKSLSTSFESFYTIRLNFGKSLSALNICSYILGIGDRHQDNFMIDTSTGNVLGIDFGHAFGSATERLGIPELIPFRLTRQLTNVFLPLTITHEEAYERNELVTQGGVFLENSVHTMQALVENKNTLISIMNIFIKEPLVEWLENTSKLENKGETKTTITASSSLLSSVDVTEEEVTNIDWFPKKKITIAIQKLSMYNPVVPLKIDLRSNKRISRSQLILDHILRSAGGDKTKNIRARCKQKCSSIREQVECLIDVATDPVILGRTFYGWGPWW